jgi:hypothetical protein
MIYELSVFPCDMLNNSDIDVKYLWIGEDISKHVCVLKIKLVVVFVRILPFNYNK